MPRPQHQRHSFFPLLFPQGRKADLDTVPPRAYEPASGFFRAADELIELDVADVELGDEDDAAALAFAEGEWSPPSSSDSCIRLRSDAELDADDHEEADALLDSLCDQQLAFTQRLETLTTQTAMARDGDVAGLGWVETRLEQLAAVRDALAVVQLATHARVVHPAFTPDAALPEYLRGVYAWTQSVGRALSQLVAAVPRDDIEWIRFGWRVEEARDFLFEDLAEVVIASVSRLRDGRDDRAVNQLLVAADVLFDVTNDLVEALARRP